MNYPHTKLAGKFYGYPTCCITSFVNDITGTNKRTPSQLQVHNGSGFIPCHNCATKIIMGQTTLEQLITERICSTEFPTQTITLSGNPEFVKYNLLMNNVFVHL
jgi:hypothetical protein